MDSIKATFTVDPCPVTGYIFKFLSGFDCLSHLIADWLQYPPPGNRQPLTSPPNLLTLVHGYGICIKYLTPILPAHAAIHFAPQELPCFNTTMSMSDSLPGISASLPFWLVSRYSASYQETWQGLPGSDAFPSMPCHCLRPR